MKTKTILFLLSIGQIISIAFTSCQKKDDKADPKQVNLDIAVTESLKATTVLAGKDIPSVSVLISTPEGTWFSSAANDPYKPITADTYFRFASNTKNFTSACILKMQELGWLNINDLITDAIPEMDEPYVPDSDEWELPFKNQITIKMLMQHVAGVYDVDNDSVPGFSGKSYTEYMQELEPNHQFNITEMVNQITINNLSYFAPGTGYHYSNTGYAILGEIISRVYSLREGTSKNLTDFMYKYLYGPESRVPLDMHFPFLATDQDLPLPFCCGYILNSSSDNEEYCSYNMSAQVAEGNGLSTMRNLLTYIHTMMRGENMLSLNSIEMMKTDVSAANSKYGLGCRYISGLGYGHNGARIGNVSTMMYDPDDEVSIVVYINAFDGDDISITLQAMVDLAFSARNAVGY